MEIIEALKSNNEIQKTAAFLQIESMIKDAMCFGSQSRTIKFAILENGFVDENEQIRANFIETKIITINIQVNSETI